MAEASRGRVKVLSERAPAIPVDRRSTPSRTIEGHGSDVTFVIGRGEDLEEAGEGPRCQFGTYRALDGSSGAPLYVDLDRPHAALVVGKRGYGKSYTLGVIAEGLARADGTAPVLVDPMGVFPEMAAGSSGDPVPTEVVEAPTVTPDALDPRAWCEMLGLSPESGAGSLVWRATQQASTLPAMREHVTDADAPRSDRRAAVNHLDLAGSWGVLDADGLSATDLDGSELTIVDVSGLDPAPANAVVHGIAEALYRGRIDGRTDGRSGVRIERLPWLLLDEAHPFFEGVARPGLETILTRGRAPGVSLVMATQRPSVVPEVAISQSDLLVSHRLTSEVGLAALEEAQPTYMQGSFDGQLPTEPGEVLVVDDATETVHAVRVRERDTPHGGDAPRASRIGHVEARK
jgi:hypothetical protein